MYSYQSVAFKFNSSRIKERGFFRFTGRNLIFSFLLNKVFVAASKAKAKKNKNGLFCTLPTHLL